MNHFKQHTYVHIVIKEIIPNKSYKLLQEKIIAISTYKLSSENHSKQYFETIATKIIPNNSYTLLPEESLQTMLTKVYQMIQVILKILPIYST